MRDHQRHQTRREFRSVSVLGRAGFRIVPTPSQTERPYFKPSSPARASLLEPGVPGTRAPGRPALTTQLSFPGEAANQQDGVFDVGLAR